MYINYLLVLDFKTQYQGELLWEKAWGLMGNNQNRLHNVPTTIYP